jgi:hypothetical protein
MLWLLLFGLLFQKHRFDQGSRKQFAHRAALVTWADFAPAFILRGQACLHKQENE